MTPGPCIEKTLDMSIGESRIWKHRQACGCAYHLAVCTRQLINCTIMQSSIGMLVDRASPDHKGLVPMGIPISVLVALLGLVCWLRLLHRCYGASAVSSAVPSARVLILLLFLPLLLHSLLPLLLHYHHCHHHHHHCSDVEVVVAHAVSMLLVA